MKRKTFRLTVLCVLILMFCTGSLSGCRKSAASSSAGSTEITYSETVVPLEQDGHALHLSCLKIEGTEPERNILLIHGVTYSSHEFDIDYEDYSLVRRLAREGYGVWRLDIAGFGQSEPVEDGFLPDSAYAAENIHTTAEKIADYTGQEKLDFLGWSWGTVTVSLYAADHPERVNHLVLYAPILSGIGAYEVTEPFHKNTWEHAADDFQKNADGSLDYTKAERIVIELFCSSCWHYDGDSSPNGGRRDLCVDQNEKLIDLSKMPVPTLVICGTNDPYLNYDLVDQCLEQLPEGSVLEKIEGASHIAYIEKPYYQDFQTRLLKYLNQ